MLTWNKSKYPWEELPELADQCDAGVRVKWDWTVAKTNSQEPGDLFFLLQQEKDAPRDQRGRGIIGMGEITSFPELREHYDEDLAAEGKTANFVDVCFEKLIDPFRHPERRLDPKAIEKAGYTAIKSGPRGSGTKVKDEEVADRLRILFEETWARGREIHSDWPPSPKDDPVSLDDPIFPEVDEQEYPEGRELFRLHRSYERSRQAVHDKKALVLKQTGALACEVCQFDFSRVYGELGRGFAECHHRVPMKELNKTGEAIIIRLADLAIVCANCHRMLHISKPWKTVQELRAIVQTYPH